MLIAAVGLIFLIIGMASFFSAFGGGGPPRLFWCCFVGMPLLFVGGVMNLAWIAVLTLVVLIQRLVPGGVWIGRIAGAFLIAWGSAMLVM